MPRVFLTDRDIENIVREACTKMRDEYHSKDYSPEISTSPVEGGTEVTITMGESSSSFIIPDAEGFTTPNWNAPEGEAGHILNRTHYEYYGEDVILPATTFHFDEDGTTIIEPAITFHTGKEYEVKWATANNPTGTTYKCTAIELEEEGEKVTLIGNIGLLLGEGDTGEPFLMMPYYTDGVAVGTGIMALDGSTGANVEIKGYSLFVKEIPEKYLKSYFEYPIDITSSISFFIGVGGSIGGFNIPQEKIDSAVGKTSRITLNVENRDYTLYPVFNKDNTGNIVSASVPVHIRSNGGDTACIIRFTCNVNVIHVDVFKIPEMGSIETAMTSTFLSRNQGVENRFKIPMVGEDGYITFVDMPEGGSSGDVIGNVDENNVITLTGNLSNGNYTFKYVNYDGSTLDIGNIEITDGEEEVLPYINQISISTDENGNVYNGCGYALDTSIGSTTGATKSNTGYSCTGFIPVNFGDVIHFKNPTLANNGNYRVFFYTANKEWIKYDETGNDNPFMTAPNIISFLEHELDTEGNIAKFTVKAYGNRIPSDTAYMRVSYNTKITNDTVITVNEEIV